MDAAARRVAGPARWTAVIAVIIGYALPLLVPVLAGLVQPFALVAAVICLGVARDRGTRLITAVCVVLVAIPLIVQGVAGLTAASLDGNFEQPATPIG